MNAVRRSGMVQAVRERAWDAYRATEAKLRRMEEGEEGPSYGEPLRSSFRHMATSGKIGTPLDTAKKYIARLEEQIKASYQRPFDGQPPPDAVTIPPLTAAQYAALKNWNIAAQVVTYGFTTLVGALSVFIATKNPWLGIVGAVAGAMWGAYEVSCIASVQEEFDEAYERSGSVTIWREGWMFNVDANSGDHIYTQANGPLSALYVAGTTLILTGKIP